MNMLFFSFFLTILSGFSTLLGSIVVLFNFKKKDRIISYSLIFAAGIMLFLSFIDLIPLAIMNLNKYYQIIPSLLFFFLFFIIGILFTKVIDISLTNDENTLYKVGLISMLALIIHNIPEGIITFLSTTKDLKLGITLAVSIAIHNIPEGISIFVPIYYSTNNKTKAFIYTFIAGFSEFLGAIIAWLFFKNLTNDFFFASLFSITAGIMIYISIKELIPEAFHYEYKNELYIIFLFGVIIMLIGHFII